MRTSGLRVNGDRGCIGCHDLSSSLMNLTGSKGSPFFKVAADGISFFHIKIPYNEEKK